jgi:hypothetical protein
LTPPLSDRVKGLNLSDEKNEMQAGGVITKESHKGKKMFFFRNQCKNKASQIIAKEQIYKNNKVITGKDSEQTRSVEKLNKEIQTR